MPGEWQPKSEFMLERLERARAMLSEEEHAGSVDLQVSACRPRRRRLRLGGWRLSASP